jgi:hypothetical protein
MSSNNTSAARVTEIVELLRPDRPRKLPESLTAAAMDGDLERMQLFLDQGADIEQRSFFASPPRCRVLAGPARIGALADRARCVVDRTRSCPVHPGASTARRVHHIGAVTPVRR